MADTILINGYEVNLPGRKTPWGSVEAQIMQDFAGRHPDKGKYVTGQDRHSHSVLVDPAIDSATSPILVDATASLITLNAGAYIKGGTTIYNGSLSVGGVVSVIPSASGATPVHGYTMYLDKNDDCIFNLLCKTNNNSKIVLGHVGDNDAVLIDYYSNINALIQSCTGYQLFQSNATNVLRLLANGRALIGAGVAFTAGDSLLHVQLVDAGAPTGTVITAPADTVLTVENGGANNYITLLTSNNKQQGIYFGFVSAAGVADNDRGYIKYGYDSATPANEALMFGLNNIQYLSIDYLGKTHVTSLLASAEIQGSYNNLNSAGDLTISGGNYFKIAGNTTINGITSTWQTGSVIYLKFDSNPLLKHNTACGAGFARLYLSGSADWNTPTAEDTLTLVFDGTYWRELARTII
jgi:hypothetical protein